MPQAGTGLGSPHPDPVRCCPPHGLSAAAPHPEGLARAEARARAWLLAGEHAPNHAASVEEPLVVDVDATLVTAHSDKEHAKPTFKKGYGFHPLCAFVDHGQEGTGEPLAILLRPGNAGSNKATDHITVLRQAFKQLPGLPAQRPGKRVLVRVDGAGYSHDLLNWLTGQRDVQLARRAGARVLATASESNHDLLRTLGAEPLMYGDGVAERVRALAPGGVHLVADFAGGVREVTTAVLAPGGRHASIADSSVIEVGGSWMWVRPDAADLAHLAGLVDSASIRRRSFVGDRFRISVMGRSAIPRVGVG